MIESVLFVSISIILLVVPIVGISYVVIRIGRAVDARDRAHRAAVIAARDAEADAGVWLGERKLLKRCSNCDTFAITLPFHDPQGRTFCSAVCRDYVAARRPTFCERCVSETLESRQDAHLNELGMGWTFGRPRDECPACHSTIRTLWLRVFLIPLLPLGSFRTIQTSPTHFASRRVPR
jgi:hypothetical protein